MYNGKAQITGPISTIVILVFMLGGCDAEQAAPDSAEKESARANVDAMSREHANDTTEPSPAAEIAPARPVVSQTMAYTEHKDELVYGYFSAPADMFEPLPAVIMIHEWWGLNDNIRQTSERLAAEGYVTLAVDLYQGEIAETPKAAMKLMQGLNADADVGRENLAAAYEYLHEGMGLAKVGVVGWCLGGRWSLQAALRLPDDIAASVIYYGGVTDDKVQLDTLQMPILGHFAAKDPIVPPDTVIAFRAALDDLGKDANIYIYPNTKHAFSNPSGLAYNKEAADLAWERTVGFLGENLQ